MAYIDKLKSGNKTFYYLGKTIRLEENKWKKLRVKLGNKKPSKELIKKKLEELKDDFKEVYQNHLKEITKTVKEKEESDFTIRFTYNSNAIEGNKLTLRD